MSVWNCVAKQACELNYRAFAPLFFTLLFFRLNNARIENFTQNPYSFFHFA